MIINEYKQEIKTTIEILNNIKSLNFSSINIYGSSNNKEIFVKGKSDIDMIVMCKNFNDLKLESITNEISNLNIDFKEKRPTIIEDNLCKRIECYFNYPNIPIDITICPGLIPNYESLKKDSWYDNFESLMGGVYINSTSIYGIIPDYDIFKELFYPFYSDDLREKRLDILVKRLSSTNELIKDYIETKNLNISDSIFKLRKYFIKFLYIYYKKYYLSPEKHTYYQLTKILNLDESEKRALCFLDGDIFEASRRYLDISNNYIEKYKNDRKKVLRKG